jgi:hypothetical protein
MSRPRIDAFGNVQFGPGPAFRGRLIQTGPVNFAIFPEKGDMPPAWLVFEEEPKKKGRTLYGTLVAETPDPSFAFQRAGCSCQTPAHMRGPARKFLQQLEPANA